MKTNKIGSLVALAMVGLLACSTAHAQQEAVWQPFQSWGGGDGVWEGGQQELDWSQVNQTSNTGHFWLDAFDRNTVTSAYFGSTPGTVTVQDYTNPDTDADPFFGAFPPVSVGIMEFNSSTPGNWVITGDQLNQIEPAPSATVIQVDSGNAGNVTIQSQLNIQENPSNGGSYFINNSTTGTLTVGNLNVDPSYVYTGGSTPVTLTNQTLIFFGANGSNTVINGTVSSGNYIDPNTGLPGNDPTVTSGILFGNYGQNSTANYYVNGPLTYSRGGSNKEFDFGSGHIFIGTSDMGTGDFCFVGNGNSDSGAAVMSILTDVGGLTINNTMYAQNRANSQIGGSTAGITTFNGSIFTGQGAGNLDLHAADGGTVIFNGNIGGDNAYTSKSGNGTVVLNEATGNSYSTPYTTQAFLMTAGTTLIQNTSGSAFGTTTTGVNATINGGATLGGFGIATQKIVAAAHTSTLAPGNGTAINTLHLNGGLSTTGTSGLTMKFDLNGALNDSIDFAAAAVVLNGAIDVSFSNLGSVLTDHVYTLLTGTGDWTGGTPTFAITAPTGYVLNAAYGTGGYQYVATGGVDSFSVEFSAAPVPEPSPILLVAVSIAGLAFLRWAHRLHTLNA